MTVRSCRMIDAEMYGMMPSAKMVRRLRFPPENRSRNPRMPPPCWRKNDSSAWKLIPGTGICPPTRYTASIRKVKMTRFLRSGMLKMFLIESIISLLAGHRWTGDHFGAPAGARDLLHGGLAEPVRLHHDRLRQFPVPEDLDARQHRLDQAFLHEPFGRDLAVQGVQRPHVDHGVLGPE